MGIPNFKVQIVRNDLERSNKNFEFYSGTEHSMSKPSLLRRSA